MRTYLAAIVGAMGLLLGPGLVVGQPVVPETPAAIGALLEGSWHGRIEAPDRPHRYLEIIGLRPNGPGKFAASTLFGWADGPISPTQADVTVDGAAATLSLVASTGTTLNIRFSDGAAKGTYRATGQAELPVSFTRLAGRRDFDWLEGTWTAQRHEQTRVFDIKRVVGTEEGTLLAIGQYGIVEEPDSVRQMVATIDGDVAKARVRWRTAGTVAELRRVKPAELLGSFEVAAAGISRRADPIVFRLRTPPPKSAVKITVGQPFPDFALVTMDGRHVRLADFRGKAVLLTFYQSWDVDQLRSFRAAKARYGDKLVVLTLNYGVARSDVSAGADSLDGIERLKIEKVAVEIKKIPTSWLIDGAGMVVEQINYLPAHKLFALLDQTVR
jgi:hypothetical protein